MMEYKKILAWSYLSPSLLVSPLAFVHLSFEAEATAISRPPPPVDNPLQPPLFVLSREISELFAHQLPSEKDQIAAKSFGSDIRAQEECLPPVVSTLTFSRFRAPRRRRLPASMVIGPRSVTEPSSGANVLPATETPSVSAPEAPSTSGVTSIFGGRHNGDSEPQAYKDTITALKLDARFFARGNASATASGSASASNDIANSEVTSVPGVSDTGATGFYRKKNHGIAKQQSSGGNLNDVTSKVKIVPYTGGAVSLELSAFPVFTFKIQIKADTASRFRLPRTRTA